MDVADRLHQENAARKCAFAELRELYSELLQQHRSLQAEHEAQVQEYEALSAQLQSHFQAGTSELQIAHEEQGRCGTVTMTHSKHSLVI